MHSEFATLVSSQRFVELSPTLLVPLVAYLHTWLGRYRGISFLDSISLAAIHTFTSTRSLPDRPHAARPRSVGFLASSSTSSLMTSVSCWPFA